MIITLCGSARFEDEFKQWNRFLTLNGHVVFSLSVYPSDMGGKTWYTPAQKVVLDMVHIEKIRASKAAFFITQKISPQMDQAQAYIGESTSRELAFALEQDKRVFYDYETCFNPECPDRLRMGPLCAVCNDLG